MMQIFPKAQYKIHKSRFDILSNTLKTLKNGQKFLKLRQSGEISSNLITLKTSTDGDYKMERKW